MLKNRRTYQQIKAHTLLELGQSEQEELKTGAMLRLERRYGKSIQELLQVNGETVRQIGAKLGLNFSTVSKWRKLLGIDSPPVGRQKGS